MKITIPGQNEPISLGGTPINPNWYLPIQQTINTLNGLSTLTGSISGSFTVTPITPGNTTASITAPAIIDATGTGVVTNQVSATGLVAAIKNDMATIAAYINFAMTNGNNQHAAIVDLNSRVTALENKIDAVISDLDARFP